MNGVFRSSNPLLDYPQIPHHDDGRWEKTRLVFRTRNKRSMTNDILIVVMSPPNADTVVIALMFDQSINKKNTHTFYHRSLTWPSKKIGIPTVIMLKLPQLHCQFFLFFFRAPLCH